jgi:uncharacterized membrane protein YheB (UPF0754 family)
MKHAAADKAMSYVDETARIAAPYASEQINLGQVIAAKMDKLTRVEYEGLLRPAFRQDEWKLIAVGAIIGALVGELQVIVFLSSGLF